MGKEKSKKRRRSSSSSDSSSDSDSSREKKKLRKLKRKLKKEQKRTEKILKKKLKEEKRKLKKKHRSSKSRSREASSSKQDATADIPIGDSGSMTDKELMEKSKAMAPMTKEQWEQKQSVVRRVLDEDSGRYRLIKGDGEVLEEIVSRDRHRQINRQATNADGAFFQAHIVDKKI